MQRQLRPNARCEFERLLERTGLRPLSEEREELWRGYGLMRRWLELLRTDEGAYGGRVASVEPETSGDG